jgi:hypothetical protein
VKKRWMWSNIVSMKLVSTSFLLSLDVVKPCQNLCLLCEGNGHLNGAKTLGYRYETFTINEDGVKSQHQEEVFGFVENPGFEVILDNASCQGGLRDWIEESGYNFQGFCECSRNPLQGYPPNNLNCMLLDAAVFGRFKVLFAENRSGSDSRRNANHRRSGKEQQTRV